MITPVFTDSWETLRVIKARTGLPWSVIRRARRCAMAAQVVTKRLVGRAEVPQYRRLCR